MSESENEGSESDTVVEIKTSFLIQEVQKIGKYDVYETKDKEFEKFCKVKYPENKSHWVKELEECLEGRIFHFYKNKSFQDYRIKK